MKPQDSNLNPSKAWVEPNGKVYLIKNYDEFLHVIGI